MNSVDRWFARRQSCKSSHAGRWSKIKQSVRLKTETRSDNFCLLANSKFVYLLAPVFRYSMTDEMDFVETDVLAFRLSFELPAAASCTVSEI